MSENSIDTEPIRLDISTLTYEAFLGYLFNREILDSEEQYEIFYGKTAFFELSKPTRLVENVTRLFNHLRELLSTYPPAQIGQGLGELFAPGTINGAKAIFRAEVPLNQRADCFNAIGRMYFETIPAWPEEFVPSIVGMLWHEIATTFWKSVGDKTMGQFASEELAAFNLMYETLKQMLAIPNTVCQEAALHGLGHLRHPDGRVLVQRYLDEHRDELSLDGVHWVETCRDGTVM